MPTEISHSGMSTILLTLDTYLPPLGVALPQAPELTNHNINEELNKVEGPLEEGKKDSRHAQHAWNMLQKAVLH